MAWHVHGNHDLGDYFALGDTEVDSAGELTNLTCLSTELATIHQEFKAMPACLPAESMWYKASMQVDPRQSHYDSP